MTKVHFSDYFGVHPKDLKKHGAFNISLLTDLPLLKDPFLLFNSKKLKYSSLHDQIIRYVRFLRDESAQGTIDPGLLRAWFIFSEVRQTWFGYTEGGNRGSGLGRGFATALNQNLH